MINKEEIAMKIRQVKYDCLDVDKPTEVLYILYDMLKMLNGYEDILAAIDEVDNSIY